MSSKSLDARTSKLNNYDETATDDDGSCVMDWMQLGQDIDGEAAVIIAA